jgi:excisionase family DNA binding protein
MNTEPLPSILSVEQVAALAGVSESTVRRAIRLGLLTGSRISPRELRFSAEDIRRWLSTTTTASPALARGQ